MCFLLKPRASESKHIKIKVFLLEVGGLESRHPGSATGNDPVHHLSMVFFNVGAG